MNKIVLLILFTVLLTIPYSFAAVFRTGDIVTISPNESISENLFISGNQVFVNSPVDADVIAAATKLELNGNIADHLIAAGQDLSVNGDINGTAFLAGRSISINSQIQKDLVVAASDITINRASVVNDDIIAAGANVRIWGASRGDVKVSAGKVNIDSNISGNLDIISNDITISKATVINGNLTYTSDKELTLEPGQVKGTTRRIAQSTPGIGSILIFSLITKIISFVSLLVVGFLLVGFFPGFMDRTAEKFRFSFWPSLGIGAIFLILVPIAVVLLFISILGIPLALILLALYFIVLFLAKLIAAYWLGDLIYHRGNRYLKMLIGLVILSILLIIPILGTLVWLVATLTSIGAFWLALVAPRRIRR